MRISVLGTLDCEELTRGPGEQVMPSVPGGARWGGGGGGAGLGALVSRDGRTAEERRAGLTPVPSTRRRGGEGRSGDTAVETPPEWHWKVSQSGALLRPSGHLRRQEALADQVPPRSRRGGGCERALRGPPSQSGHSLPASLHLLGFSRLLRASWGTLGTKTADPASPAAAVAHASIAPVGLNSGPLRLDQANLRCRGEERLRPRRSALRLGGGEEPASARLKAAAPVLWGLPPTSVLWQGHSWHAGSTTSPSPHFPGRRCSQSPEPAWAQGGAAKMSRRRVHQRAPRASPLPRRDPPWDPAGGRADYSALPNANCIISTAY